MSYQRDFEKRLRVGIVGLGSHCYRNVLPAMHYLPVKLTAFCDANIELARKTAPEYGVTNVYAKLGEMLAAEKLDAMFLAVGERFHPDLACEAFDAGVHVWMEKPVAIRTHQVAEMIRRRKGLTSVVGIKKAFMPATEKAYELFGQPGAKYGPIRSILGVYPIGIAADADAVFTKGVGHPWLNCCHPLGFMLAVGGPVASVSTHRGKIGGAVVVLNYANGAIGNLHLAEGAAGSQPIETYTVIGNGSHLVVDNVDSVLLQRGVPFQYGVTTNFCPPGEDHGGIVWQPQRHLGTLENKADLTHGMVGELMHFCEHALAGTPATRGTLEFAHHVMEIYEATMQSQGDTIALPAEKSD